MPISQTKPSALSGTRYARALWAGTAVALSAALALSFQVAMLRRIVDRWDDEGYLMVMVHHYLQGHKLYVQLFSQYGPFYVEAQAALFRLLHQPVTSDGNRMVTMLWWTGGSLLAGLFVYRLQRNTFLACAASLALCLESVVLSAEPGHPQQVVLLLMMLACFATTLRAKPAAVVFGMAVAAICLTKINVGVFTVAAALGTLVAVAPRGRLRRAGEVCLLFYAAAFPAVLMRLDLGGMDRWYCVIATLVGLVTFAATFALSEGTGAAQPRRVGMVVSFIVLAAASIGWQVAKGVSVSSLIDGILIAPLHHPMVFNLPLDSLSGSGAICTAVLCVLSLAVVFSKRMTAKTAGWWMLLVPCVVLGLVFLKSGRFADIVLALLPVGLLVLRRTDLTPEARFARVFVTLFTATQMLHAYPVAGSQVRIGLTPAVLWCFLCFDDGCTALAKAYGRPVEWSKTVSSRLALLTIALLMTARLWILTRPPLASLEVPGARHLLLPSDRAAAIENITTNLRANCDMLASLPGLGSFNFWTGIPLPDTFFMNGWVPGVPLDEQQHTLERLKSDPQACVVYYPWATHFWHFKQEDMMDHPLSRYMLTEMRPVHTAGEYQILVQPNRTKPWTDIRPDVAP